MSDNVNTMDLRAGVRDCRAHFLECELKSAQRAGWALDDLVETPQTLARAISAVAGTATGVSEWRGRNDARRVISNPPISAWMARRAPGRVSVFGAGRKLGLTQYLRNEVERAQREVTTIESVHRVDWSGGVRACIDAKHEGDER